MNDDADESGRAVAGYNPEIATISPEEFVELMALARERPPLTPDGQWRHDYHAAMIAKRTIGVQPDLFGAWCFIREWGRIGRAGQVRTVPYATADEAHEALARQHRALASNIEDVV